MVQIHLGSGLLASSSDDEDRIGSETPSLFLLASSSDDEDRIWAVCRYYFIGDSPYSLKDSISLPNLEIFVFSIAYVLIWLRVKLILKSFLMLNCPLFEFAKKDLVF